MKNHELFIVDVFAEGKYQGNQLGVVRDAGDIPEETLLQIARELHFSETAFVLSETPKKIAPVTTIEDTPAAELGRARSSGLDFARSTGLDSAWPVRIFTPEREVPFAGHPTLGTAFVIKEFIKPGTPGAIKSGTPDAIQSVRNGGPAAFREELPDSLVLGEPAGLIPVSFDSAGVGWMEQLPPRFGRIFTPEEVAPTVGLDPRDIDRSLPIQEVSTGLPFMILPLAGIDAVRRARLQRESFFALTESTEAKDILLFSREAQRRENHLHIRVFTEYEGIPEDPATGSAGGCLCGYLVEHNAYGGTGIDLRGEQGYEIGRPSLLYLKGRKTGSGISVVVGGRVVPVARGTLL